MNTDMKVLFIIVNEGFSDGIVEVTQNSGAKGATIIPARGTGAKFKKVLGIHYEPAREIIMSIVSADVADKIITTIKEKFGKNTPTNGICLMMPVEKTTVASDGLK